MITYSVAGLAKAVPNPDSSMLCHQTLSRPGLLVTVDLEQSHAQGKQIHSWPFIDGSSTQRTSSNIIILLPTFKTYILHGIVPNGHTKADDLKSLQRHTISPTKFSFTPVYLPSSSSINLSRGGQKEE